MATDTETSPVEDTTSPVENKTTPVEDITSPVEDITSPVEDTTSPVEDTTSPVEDTTSPVEDITSPVEDTTSPSDLEAMDIRIKQATNAILAAQREDGHWCYEYEADAMYPADYIFMVRFLGETPDIELEQKMGRYLRGIQLPDGGWPHFKKGPTSVNASVLAYLALKMIGDSPDAEHMVRARKAILAAGGAETANVFARIRLCWVGILPWEALPILPVEMILLPKWFVFHLSKVACWARTIIIPLSVLQAKRAHPRQPHGVRIDELFHTPPEKVGLLPQAPHQNTLWFSLFRSVNTVLHQIEPRLSPKLRQRAIDKAVEWVEEHVRPGEGLFAASFNSVNALLMFDALGYPATHPPRVALRNFIESLLFFREDEAYLQICASPTWDTALVAHTLLETRDLHAEKAALRGLEWLRRRQILDVAGDWAVKKPNLLPGGWPFQYGNKSYPDLDDTAMVLMAMHRADPVAFAEAIQRGRDWVVGMQTANGGWASFEVDNTDLWLKQVPFSDQGFLIDPPTADVTGRCLCMLGQSGELPETSEVSRRGLAFVLKEQEPDGKWWGQWGVNYTHGTWFGLSALNSMGVSHEDPRVKRAVEWLVSVQNEDGGWGEDPISYERECYVGAPSGPTQTAWALLGLMAGGAVHHPAVGRGVEWLLRTQCDHGVWEDDSSNECCAARLPFLIFHGYHQYFPLWALARYRNLKRDGVTRVAPGI
nr:PREDICTED: uncharacterized protein LOC109030156 [Bemisia tabaci]